MIFQINRCSNAKLKPGKPRCKSKPEIDAFISRVLVDTWTNYYKIDFTIHGDERTAYRKEKYER